MRLKQAFFALEKSIAIYDHFLITVASINIVSLFDIDPISIVWL